MGTSSKDSQRKSGAPRGPRMTGTEPPDPSTSPSLSALLRAFEANVIPSLLKANRHRPLVAASSAVEARPPSEVKAKDVTRIANAAMEADPGAILGQVHGLRARGLSLETIFLDVLAPAARLLGLRWERDEIDFVAVTSALGRIHHAVRELAAVIPGRALRRSRSGSPRILLAPTPGEQHNLGVLMVAEFFRREGWEVVDFPAATLETLVAAVEQTAFDVLGLSLGSEVRLNTLVSTVEALRTASKNPDVGLMIGGAVFALSPELVRRVPADAVATDAASAVRLAEALLRKINLRLLASRSTTALGSSHPSSAH